MFLFLSRINSGAILSTGFVQDGSCFFLPSVGFSSFWGRRGVEVEGGDNYIIPMNSFTNTNAKSRLSRDGAVCTCAQLPGRLLTLRCPPAAPCCPVSTLPEKCTPLFCFRLLFNLPSECHLGKNPGCQPPSGPHWVHRLTTQRSITPLRSSSPFLAGEQPKGELVPCGQ